MVHSSCFERFNLMEQRLVDHLPHLALRGVARCGSLPSQKNLELFRSILRHTVGRAFNLTSWLGQPTLLCMASDWTLNWRIRVRSERLWLPRSQNSAPSPGAGGRPDEGQPQLVQTAIRRIERSRGRLGVVRFRERARGVPRNNGAPDSSVRCRRGIGARYSGTACVTPGRRECRLFTRLRSPVHEAPVAAPGTWRSQNTSRRPSVSGASGCVDRALHRRWALGRGG